MVQVLPSTLARILKTLGIETKEELLWHLPARYLDFRNHTTVKGAKVGEVVSIVGTVTKSQKKQAWPKKRSHAQITIEDKEKTPLNILWFNQGYVADQLKVGDRVVVSGKVTVFRGQKSLNNPQYEPADQDHLHTARLVPHYTGLRGIPLRTMRRAISYVLTDFQVTDEVPASILKKYRLMPLAPALQEIHFPTSDQNLKAATWRLAFQQKIVNQLAILLYHRRLKALAAPKISLDTASLQELVNSLPYRLTNSQKLAVWHVAQDLVHKSPMSRLVAGDVGSGKTLVAILCGSYVVKSGLSALLIAPTEILARQHYETFLRLQKQNRILSKIPLALLTGSSHELNGKTISRASLEKVIQTGPVFAVGTHALLAQKLRPKNLALLVVDEQHRFGVKHRANLRQKTSQVPHLLSLTATPIPRTLALTLYGELALSQLTEKPSGKSQVRTLLVPSAKRDEAYSFLSQTAAKGEQSFVVAPHISSDDEQEVVTVSQARDYVGKHAPGLSSLVLHGQLKTEKQAEVLEDFRNGKANVLVATSMVEVGVDIPRASCMVVESPEHFGLAQLHQLRGRVGRAGQPACCVLVTGAEASSPEHARLEHFAKITDGWKLAEEDLKIRGIGSLFGEDQSGGKTDIYLDLKDLQLLKAAAEEWIQLDPELTRSPRLGELAQNISINLHLE